MSSEIRPSARPFLLLIVLLSAISIQACRAAPALPSPPPGASTPAAGPTHLTLWHSETGNARQALEALLKSFHDAYPDLEVDPVYVGTDGDLSKKVAAAIALGRAPDLVIASRREIADFARQGGLFPLDELRDDPDLGFKEEDRSDLFPGITDEAAFVEFGKAWYGFPFDVDAMVLYFNPEMLTAASYSDPPGTWADFLDIASKVTKDEQFGWAMYINSDVMGGMLVIQGSAPVNVPERRSLFAERAGLASMTLAAQLVKSGAAQPGATRADALKAFANGNAAFYIDWLSAVDQVDKAREDAGGNWTVGIANLPQRDPGERFVYVRSSEIAVFKMPVERARQAWFLIRWLTASKQTAQWALAARSIPLRASALPFLVEGGSTPQLRQIQSNLNGTPPRFVPRSANPRIAQIEHDMEDAWFESIQPKADIEAVLSGHADEANAVLAGNR
ncbi:MAG: extracellular solute-binding protein [Rudaea sp.]